MRRTHDVLWQDVKSLIQEAPRLGLPIPGQVIALAQDHAVQEGLGAPEEDIPVAHPIIPPQAVMAQTVVKHLVGYLETSPEVS